MRNLVGASLSALVISASATWSQDTARPVTDGYEAAQAIGEGEAFASSKWARLQSEVPREDIVEALEGAGASTAAVEAAASNLGAGTFDLYARPLAPGLASYLVVPQGEAGLPQEFLVPGSGALLAGFTAEDIRREIIEGMQASIDALCAMRARPTEIRVQASAMSILEIEATWAAADVCAEQTP